MFDGYHKWLGIPPAEQPPHHYRLLAITAFEADLDVIDAAANRQMSFLRECGQGPHVSESQTLLNEVSAARLTLLNAQKKAAYDAALRARLAAKGPPTPSERAQKALEIDTRSARAPAATGNPMLFGAIAAGLALVLVVGGLAWRFSSQSVALNSPATTDAASVSVRPQVPALPPDVAKPETKPEITKRPEPPEVVRPAPPKSEEKRLPPRSTPKPDPEEKEAPKKSPPDPQPAPKQEFPPLEPRKVEPGGSKKGVPPISTDPDENGNRVALAPEKTKDPPAAPRVAVPPKEALSAVEKLIKELFKAEYASRKPEERAALAKKLLSQGIETSEDPSSQYVLFCEARDVAAALGETDTAFKAVEALIQRFEIEPEEEQFQVLSSLSRSVRTPEGNQVLLDRSIAALDGSIDADNFESAKKLATLAGSVAKKAQNVKAVGQMATRVRDIENLKKEFDKAKEAQAALKGSPDDAAANLVVGRYLCLAKGDFEKGLPHLAKGDDEALKALAARELADPKEPAEQLALADQWWAQGEKERDPAKSNMQGHAIPWYDKALPTLKGLAKTQIEAKIKTFSAEKPERTKGRHLADILSQATWQAALSDGAKYVNLRFEAGGVMKFRDGNGGDWTGTWAREGQTVVTVVLGHRDIYRLVDGKILIDHFNAGSTTPTSRGAAMIQK